MKKRGFPFFYFKIWVNLFTKFFLCLILIEIFAIKFSFGQNNFNDKRVKTHYSDSSKSLSINYFSESATLRSGINLKCRVYFLGPHSFKKNNRNTFPFVFESALSKQSNAWACKIESIPEGTNSFVLVFFDSLGNLDNNNGHGYWSSLNESQPGSLASIGEFYSLIWSPSSFYVEKQLKTARLLFEEDFRKDTTLKKEYLEWYLSTLNFSVESDIKLLRDELSEYVNNSYATEETLNNLMIRYCPVLNDTALYNKFERRIQEKYPKGSMATQKGALSLLIKIQSSRDFETQKKYYLEFKQSYSSNFSSEPLERALKYLRAQMLGYLAKPYAKTGLLDVWMKEASDLDDEFKAYTYQQAVWHLLQVKGGKLDGKKYFKTKNVEYKRLNYSLENDNQFAEIAQILSEKSVELWKNVISGPRRYIDPPIFTMRQVIAYKEERLSEFLDILGISLLRQNKFDEAIQTFREASIKWGKKNDSEINENYIVALVKNTQFEEALIEMENFIALGKSTNLIDSIYKNLRKSRVDFDSLKGVSSTLIKSQLKVKEINEPLPDFALYDVLGNETKLSKFKGKIIILDLWATWCPPCVESLKSLEELSDRLSKRSDIVFVLLNVEKDRNRAKEFINRKVRKKLYFIANENEAMKKFKINGIPTKLIIDKRGIVRFKEEGISYNFQEEIDEIASMVESVSNK